MELTCRIFRDGIIRTLVDGNKLTQFSVFTKDYELTGFEQDEEDKYTFFKCSIANIDYVHELKNKRQIKIEGCLTVREEKFLVPKIETAIVFIVKKITFQENL